MFIFPNKKPFATMLPVIIAHNSLLRAEPSEPKETLIRRIGKTT
jgi:hypothetical protein